LALASGDQTNQLVMRGALLARRASADHGPASLSAGPRFGDRIASREHVRRPVEIAAEHRIVRHGRVAAHAWSRSAAR